MAHGLVLRMQDMMEYRRSDKAHNEQGTPYVACNPNPSSGDVNIPKLWANAVESPKNSKMEFLTLLRRTLLFMFSSKWTMYEDKGDLLCALKYHYRAFSTITDNTADIFKAVLDIFKKDPWKNSFFLWEDLFDGTLTIYDKRVQDYFESEPEEVVIARVHALVSRKRPNDALCLAKASFLYHSRIAKSFRSRRRNSTSGFSTKGHASIDWFLFILKKMKSLDFIVNEAKQLECHEGVEIVCRLWRDPKNKPICYALLQIFLLHDLLQPSKYCCTKRLLKLFCLMHEELHSSPKEIAESCHKLFSKHAPSTAHFYLFVDVLWRQFGLKCLDLYVDLYVRGLTADINNLENKRHLEAFSDATSLETHIAAIFMKLSTLFNNFNSEIARECMFSAFSLRPTKEKLFLLQRLSQSLSKSNKDIHKSLLNFDFSADCNCGLRCIGHCRDILNKSSFIHPLLSSSIGNISHVLKRDFISVLENVRGVTLQYNVFDWQCNIGDLGNYLSSFSQEKAVWKKSESDTESGEEICASGVEDTETVLETANDLRGHFDHPSIKRNCGSDCSKEINHPNVEENIVAESCDSTSKRMKTENLNVEVSVTVSSNNTQIKGFHDYVENVIKMSLNNNPAKSWSDTMNLLNVKKEPIISDFNSSRIYRKPENSLQSCLSERNAYNNQICTDRKNNLLHYSDKTHLQISAYNHTQQSVAVLPKNNNPFKEIASSEHQILSKSHLIQMSPAKASRFTATQPVSETFPNSISSPKHEKCSNQEITSLHFAAKSERERPVHNHHLHSSPFVSSQPPPKSFSKHQLKINSFGEEKAQTMASLTTQEVRESIPCDNTRKSVIVNVAGKSLQIPNQLPVPVKPSAIHQNGNILQKDCSTLPLLHVNVPNKYLTKSDGPVNANLMIPYKFDNPVSSSASQTSAHNSKVEVVAVPGIIAPPSMIKNNPWKTTVQNHANTFFPTKISDGTPPSGLAKVSPKSYKMQLFQPKTSNDLALKRNASNMSKFGTSVFKPMKSFDESSKNNLQNTVTNKEMTYSSAQQINNFPDPKLKWTMRQVHDSSRSQMTFHPITDSQSVPVTTISQPWYASPYPKTSSNSPVSSTHKMNSPKMSCNSPVSFSAHKMNTPTTSCNSPVSFCVQNMKPPTTNSNSPVSFSVHNMKTLESFGDKKVSTYADGNDHNFSNDDNVQIKPGSSFLKSRLTSMHNTQSYSHMNVYSYENSFSTQDKAYSESHKSSQNQKYPIPERSVHSFISSANVTTNSIPSSQIQSNSTSAYNPVYPANDRRAIVREARNIAASSNVQNIKSNVYPQPCCSPFEVNPCDTCTNKTSNQQFLTKTQVIGFRSSPVENLHNQVTDGISSGDNCFEVSKNRQQQSETEEPQKMCTFCSFMFPASLIKTHIEDAHQELFNNTNYNIQNQILSKETSFSVSNSQAINMTNYDSQNDNRMSLENNIQSACNTALVIENSQSGDQFINKLLDFMDPNFDKSMESSYENTGNSHPINSNESPCDNSKSESLSEMLNEVDFSRNISSDLSAICDGNELSYDMIEDKQSSVENPSNENKDIKSWYNNLSLDLLSNDDKPEKKMATFEISEFKPQSSETSSLEQKISITNNKIDLEDKETSEKLKHSYEIFRTDQPLEQSNLMRNIQELDGIANFQNTSNEQLNNSAVICPICKSKLDVDMQQHINICHPRISGDTMVCKKLNSSNNSETDARSGPNVVFMPRSSYNQMNPSEIFDFDSYSSENAAKEMYRPLQKGKPKLCSSNSSCNSENNMMNIQTKLDAEETVYEMPTSKKKGPRVICGVCTKVYSKSYIKTHFRKDHVKDQPSNYFKMSENSSNQSLSGQTAISSSTPEKNQSFPCISATLLQEDIDTRTCLSTSDALNSSNKFEGSGIKKTFSHDSSNMTVRMEQKYPFHSVTEGVKESFIGNLNFELLEKPPKTALKEKKAFNSKQKPNTTKIYQCNWSQNGNYCDQNFKSKLLLNKHLKAEHISTGIYKCNWFQNNNYCNQIFRTEPLLFKHLKTEHVRKNSSKCDIQQNMTQNNASPTLDRSEQMKENRLFYDATNNKDSVFVHENLQKTEMIQPESDLPFVNLNHEFRKGNNSVNSVMQCNSDKAISFSHNEHALPVFSENLDNQLYFEIPEKNDKCHLSPKPVSRLFSNSMMNDIVPAEKISLKQSDVSDSVNESYEKSFNKDELSNLLNSFKDSTHEVNDNNLPQEIYERYNALPFVSDTKENSENDNNLVQNSILNENPSSVSYDFVTKDIDSGGSILSLTGNSDSSSKQNNSFSNLLHDLEEMNELSAGNGTLISKEGNKYEKSRTDSLCEMNKDEKHNKVFGAAKSSENSNSQNAQYPISAAEIIQQGNKLNLTLVAQVVNKSPVTALPKMSQFGAAAVNFRINSPEDCNDNLIELKENLNFQTQLTEAFNDHESIISVNNVIDEEQYVKTNESASSVTKIPVSNSFPSLSESDEKDMPILVPEFDFQPLLVSENFKTVEDIQGLEKKLKRSDFYSFPNEIPTASDISCSTNVVAVSSAVATIINNQEPFCVSSIPSNTSCTYPKVLTTQDSKEYEALSFLNEEYPAFSSVETLQDLSVNEVGLVESDMKSKSNSVSTEQFNNSSCKEKEIYVIQSEALNSLPVRDLGKKFISSDKDGIESCRELMDSGKTFGYQLSKVKLIKKSLALFSDSDSLKENIEDKLDVSIFEQDIKKTVNNMLTIVSSCENSALSNIGNYKRDECGESRKASSISEGIASSYSPVFDNSDCGENNLRILQLCSKKENTVPCEISVNQNTKTGKNSSMSCVLCDNVFQSDEGLSDHLKLIHDLPHLKKQISKSRKKSSVENVDKLSPPPLYLNSAYDYDSASAESSPNKYNEENCKNGTLEEASNTESEPSLLESSSNIDLEFSERFKSFSTANQISSKCKKGANIIKSKHRTEKHNKMDAFVCSHERKNRKDISNKLSSDNIVSDPLNKELIDKNGTLLKCFIKIRKDNSVSYEVHDKKQHKTRDRKQYKIRERKQYKIRDRKQSNSVSHRIHDPPDDMSKCDSLLSSNYADSNPIESVESSMKRKQVNGKLKKRSKKRALKPKDIKQFLIDNKQPDVLLTRLDCSLLNSFNVSASKPDFTYINFICKRATVKVKKLPQSIILKYCFPQPDPATVGEKTLGTSLKLPDDIDEEIISSKFPSATVGQKTLGTSLKFPDDIHEEISSKFPSIKNCRVLIERVPSLECAP